jgi:hypothetical protein
MATKKKQPPEPKVFFERAVPRVLSIMKATCAELGGRYSIEVDGAGAWTLDFVNTKVSQGRVDGADVFIAMTPAQFGSLTSGKVELLKLVSDGAVRCEGDRSKVENVSLVLAFLEM